LAVVILKFCRFKITDVSAYVILTPLSLVMSRES